MISALIFVSKSMITNKLFIRITRRRHVGIWMRMYRGPKKTCLAKKLRKNCGAILQKSLLITVS